MPLLLQFVEVLADHLQQRVNVFSLKFVKTDLLRQLEALEALLRKLLCEVKALKVNGKLIAELFAGLTVAGLRHLLPGFLDMPNSVTNGKLPPMTLHHILLESTSLFAGV